MMAKNSKPNLTAQFFKVTVLFTLAFFLLVCTHPEDTKFIPNYNNVMKDATYVGREICKNCHYDKFSTFVKSEMGIGWRPATKQNSVYREVHALVYDSSRNFYYQPFWEGDTLCILEFRLVDKDTVYKRVECADYFVGSGQHTQSNIQMRGKGYLYQLPITYYTQRDTWDMAPGFKNNNTRFFRAIKHECITCHNDLPVPVRGSEHKFVKVPHGIGCERCHGPGSEHVNFRMSGKDIPRDQNTNADLTIVNPKHLSKDLKMSICMRCHLQGVAVPLPGKSFYDFKPGMHITEVMDIFTPMFSGDTIIMASQVERLMQSKCYQENELTCITCHDPHVSIRTVPIEHFNKQCMNCHDDGEDCGLSLSKRLSLNNNNCVNCHMPKRGSVDIPHVAITDHKIGIFDKKEPTHPPSKWTFKGLKSWTQPHPPTPQITKAYLYFYEKFHPYSYVLDSARRYLHKLSPQKHPALWIHFYYLTEDYDNIINLVPLIENDTLLDGWTAYRIAIAYKHQKMLKKALYWLEKATSILPYQLDFQNELGTTLAILGDWQEAEKVFRFIVNEDPYHYKAWNNLGYLYLLRGKPRIAITYFKKALALDPDYTQASVNLQQAYQMLEMGKTN